MRGLVQQWLRFCAVGVVNTAVGVSAMFATMYFLEASPGWANVLGYASGLAVGFALNRSWTFNQSRLWRSELSRYLLLVAACYLLNLTAVLAATSQGSVDPYLAQLMGMSIYSLGTFFGCRHFVFRERPCE